MTFKVGDKVRAVKTEDGKLPNGTGLVINISSSIVVLFKDWTKGHNGTGKGKYSEMYPNSHWAYNKYNAKEKLILDIIENWRDIL